MGPHTVESITDNLRAVDHVGLHIMAFVREDRDITFGLSVEVQNHQSAMSAECICCTFICKLN